MPQIQQLSLMLISIMEVAIIMVIVLPLKQQQTEFCPLDSLQQQGLAPTVEIPKHTPRGDDNSQGFAFGD